MYKFKITHLLCIVSVILLTFLVWHKTLEQTFIEEGYYYFDPGQRFFYKEGIASLTDYDNFAKFFSDILIRMFGDNIYLFQLTQLLVFILVYLTIFFVLFKITNSTLLSLTATIFFLASYVGSFQMLATGNYQRFLQRVPNIIPLLLAFYTLHTFYKNPKGYPLFSFTLFGLSIIMAHYSSLFLPIFIAYPLVEFFRTKRKQPLKTAVIISIFLLINTILTSQSPQKPGNIQPVDHLLEKVLFQITLITIPHDLIVWFSDIFIKTPKPYIDAVRLLSLPVLLFYLWGAFATRKSRFFYLYITFLLALLLHITIYQLIDGDKFNVFRDFGQDRHYFISSLFIGVVWAILLSTLSARKRLYTSITAVFLTLFITYNSYHIWNHADSIQYRFEGMKKFVSFLKGESKNWGDQSVVVIPGSLMGSTSLLSRVGDLEGVEFILPSKSWQNKLPHKDKVFIYDYKYSDNRLFEKEFGQPINWTDNFRKGEHFNFYSN